MSKRELIDRIRMLNPTAPTSFLARFDEAELNRYLVNLLSTSVPMELGAGRPTAVPGTPGRRELALAS